MSGFDPFQAVTRVGYGFQIESFPLLDARLPRKSWWIQSRIVQRFMLINNGRPGRFCRKTLTARVSLGPTITENAWPPRTAKHSFPLRWILSDCYNALLTVPWRPLSSWGEFR